MASRALAEERLRPFLRRRRRAQGDVELPPVGRLLAETLDLAARLVPAASGFVALDEPEGAHTSSRPRAEHASATPSVERTSARPRAQRGERRPDPAAMTLVAAFGDGTERHVGATVASSLEETAARGEETGTVTLIDEAVRHGRTALHAARGREPARIAVAVRLEHAVCGVFVVTAPRGGSFSERDQEIVELLARYVSRAILNGVDVLKQNELARRDELTGVRNVRGLHDELAAAVKGAVRARADLAVLFVDVDHLKRVNDQLGHAAGSETLKRVGQALAHAVGEAGVVYRFGGDEFVVVVPALALDAARALAAELRRAVSAGTAGALRHVGVLPGVTVSIGVATLRGSLRPRGDERRRAPRLLLAADRALYRAKHAGRDAVSVATQRDDAARPATR